MALEAKTPFIPYIFLFYQRNVAIETMKVTGDITGRQRFFITLDDNNYYHC